MPEPEAPTGPITVQLGVCASCDALFLLSGRRPYSGCHGADSILTLATLVLSEDGRITGAWGPDAAPPQPVTAAPAAPPESAVAPSAALPEPHGPTPITPEARAEIDQQLAEEEAEEVAHERSWIHLAGGWAMDVIEGDSEDVVGLRFALLGAGAEAEDVETAIGRLIAVRDFLQKLAPQGA